MGKLSEGALMAIAGAAAVLLACLLVVRWGGPPAIIFAATNEGGKMNTPDPEAAELVRQEFWVIPRVVATIPIVKPPPAPDRPYVIPKAQEGEPIVPPEPEDVCARHGMRRITFVRHHHEGWRCVHRRRR